MRSTCGVRRRDDQHFGLGDWTELEGKRDHGGSWRAWGEAGRAGVMTIQDLLQVPGDRERNGHRKEGKI
jgi:hypothetical protein